MYVNIEISFREEKYFFIFIFTLSDKFQLVICNIKVYNRKNFLKKFFNKNVNISSNKL